MFSKSASDDSYKWQICTYFGYCCPFLKKKGRSLLNIYPIIPKWGKHNLLFTTLSRSFDKILTLSNLKTSFHCPRLIGFFL